MTVVGIQWCQEIYRTSDPHPHLPADGARCIHENGHEGHHTFVRDTPLPEPAVPEPSLDQDARSTLTLRRAMAEVYADLPKDVTVYGRQDLFRSIAIDAYIAGFAAAEQRAAGIVEKETVRLRLIIEQETERLRAAIAALSTNLGIKP